MSTRHGDACGPTWSGQPSHSARPRYRWGPAFAGVTTALALMTGQCAVWACDCIFPGGHFVVEKGAELPSNAKALPYVFSYWHDCSKSDAGAAFAGCKFKVEQIDGKRVVQVPHTVQRVSEPKGKYTGSTEVALVTVTPSFITGKRYRFSSTNDVVVVQVVDAEVTSVTTTIETAATTGRLQIAAPGSCFREVEATQIRLTMQLPAQARKFAGAMMFTTFVDGEVWRPEKDLCEPVDMGRSWQGAGRDLVFGTCSGGPGVDGKRPHTVRIDATLPGTDVRVTGSPVRIDPFCKPEPVPAPPTPAPRETGCGQCSYTHAGPSPWAPLSLMALALACAAARRRRSSQQSQ